MKRPTRAFIRRLSLISGVLLLSCLLLASPVSADSTPDCADAKYEVINGAYAVTNATELQCIGHGGTDLSDDFVLSENINLTTDDVGEWNDGDGFKPIGDGKSKFTGTFDGNGHSINGLTINRSAARDVGLFGHAEGSGVEIANLRLQGINITGGTNTGGVAGTFDGPLMDNVSVSGAVRSEGAGVSGGGIGGDRVTAGLIAGFTNDNHDIDFDEISARGTVSADPAGAEYTVAAGLIGATGGSVDVSTAYAQATIEDADYGGGAIGWTSNVTSTYDNLYATPIFNDVETAGAVVAIIGSGADHAFADSVYYNNSERDAVGVDYGDPGVTTDWVGLTTEEMTGDSALDTMDELDFADSWAAPTGAHPIFQWQYAAVDTPDDFFFGDVEAQAGDGNITVSATEFGIPVPGIEIEVLEGGDVDSIEGIDPGDTETTDDGGEATFAILEPAVGTYDVIFAIADDHTVNDTATIEVVAAPPDWIEAEDSESPLEVEGTLTTEVNNTDEFGNTVVAGDDVVEVISYNEDALSITDSATTEVDNGKIIAAFDYTGWAVGEFDVTFSPVGTDVEDTATITITDVECGEITHANAGGVYQIGTPAELQCMGSSDNTNMDDNFELTSNIDLGAANVKEWHDDKGFEPIGHAKNAFEGTFDGHGYRIAGLSINRPNQNNIGLIGYAHSSNIEVKNTRFVDVDVHGFWTVGGVAGYFRSGSIENVSVDGSVTGDGSTVGGIAGRAWDADLDNQLYFNGTVTAENDAHRGVGGIAGRSSGSTTISTAYVRGEVIGPHAGGLVGSTSTGDSTFSAMYFAGTVDDAGSGDQPGAIAGMVESSGDEFKDSVYWDETLAPTAIGKLDSSATYNQVGLETAQMQGSSAQDEYMTNLSFADTWAAPTGTYPVFQWQLDAVDDPDDLFFGQVNATAGDGKIVVSATEFGIPVPDITIVVIDEGDVSELDGIDPGDTATTDANGDATFETTEESAGAYALTFALEEDTTFNDTTIVNVVGNPESLDSLEATDVTVTEGDTGDIAVTILDEYGNGVADEPIEVSDNADDLSNLESQAKTNSNGIATFSFEEGSTGDYTVVFESDADALLTDTATVTVESEPSPPSPAAFAVTIDETNDPVTETAPLEVNVSIENTGDASDDQTITLEDADESVLDSTNISLDGGEETSILLTWNTAVGDAGTHELTVASDDDSASTNVAIEEDPDPAPEYEVSITDTNDPVNETEPLDVTVSIENIGTGPGETTISLADFNGSTVDSTPVNLSSAETTTATLTWETALGDAGTDTIIVSSETANATTSVTIYAHPDPHSDFVIAIDATNEPIAVGDQLSVDTTIENVGGAAGSQAIVLEDITGLIVDRVDVDLDAGALTTESLAWTPDEADAGLITVRSENDSAQTNVTIAEPDQQPFTVTVDETNAPVTAGDDVEITVEIENDGVVEETQDIALLDEDGTVLDSTSVTLAPGDSTTVTLAWQSDADAVGAQTVVIESTTEETDLTVELADPDAEEQPEIAVSPDRVNFGDVAVGETETRFITIENLVSADAPLTVDQVVLVGQDPDSFAILDGDDGVELAPGESHDIEVGFTPEEAGVTNAQLRIFSDDAENAQIDIWLSNTGAYLAVQERPTDDPTVNVNGTEYAAGSDLSVNVSQPSTRATPAYFDQLNMTFADGGDFAMDLVHTPDALAGGSVFEHSNDEPIQYVTIVHSEEIADPSVAFEETEIAFNVNRDEVDDASDVELYRHDGDDWVAMDAGLVGETSTTYRFVAETPGFSEFVITRSSADADPVGCGPFGIHIESDFLCSYWWLGVGGLVLVIGAAGVWLQRRRGHTRY